MPNASEKVRGDLGNHGLRYENESSPIPRVQEFHELEFCGW